MRIPARRDVDTKTFYRQFHKRTILLIVNRSSNNGTQMIINTVTVGNHLQYTSSVVPVLLDENEHFSSDSTCANCNVM
jgi:hypothetical protein